MGRHGPRDWTCGGGHGHPGACDRGRGGAPARDGRSRNPALRPPAPQRFSLPEGPLKITPSSLPGGAPGTPSSHFMVRLADSVPGASLTVRLPRRWISVPASGIRATRLPRLARSARHRARAEALGPDDQAGSRAHQGGTDRQLRHRRPRHPAALTGCPSPGATSMAAAPGPAGRRSASTLPSREGPTRRTPGRGWRTRASRPTPATTGSRSPRPSSPPLAATRTGSRSGSTGAAEHAGWICRTAARAGRSGRCRPPSTPRGSPANEAGDICCDPMFAADDLGTSGSAAWRSTRGRGARAASSSTGSRRRSTTFHSATAGLRVRPRVIRRTEDKPMMTIDNDPGEPDVRAALRRVGRAARAAVNLVEIAQCDTPAESRRQLRQRRQLVDPRRRHPGHG